MSILPRRPQQPAAAPAPERVDESAELQVVRWLSQLSTDVAQSVQGVALRGARAVPVAGVDGAQLRPTTAAGRIVGWSLRAADGDGATVRLRDGVDATGDLVAVLQLAPGGSSTQWLGPGGVHVSAGLFVELTGQAEGAVYLGAVD